MTVPIRVCLRGFSAFEQGALASSLRLAVHRTPRYLPVVEMSQSDLIVVDADHAEALADVVRTGRLEHTVYIAAHVERDSTGWLARPLDPTLLLRELDRLALAARAATPADIQAPAHTAHAAEAAPDEMPKRAHVLLVDDSEIALRFLETRLQRHGVDSTRANGSGRALELIAQRAFDMVFLDVELGPGSELDGLALCQHIKRHHHHAGSRDAPAVVLVSAHHGEIDRARGALAGCDDYLGKPLDEHLLQRVLVKHGAVHAPSAHARV